MEDKIYLRVEDVKFDDLFDWSKPQNKGQTTTVTIQSDGLPGSRPRSLRRQSSQTGRLVEVNLQKVALFRYNNTLYAVNEKCPHAGGPLHVGDIEVLPDESICVRCPWHSWCYDLETGQVKRPEGHDLKATIYPTKVTENGDIFVGFDSFSAQYFDMNDCDF